MHKRTQISGKLGKPIQNRSFQRFEHTSAFCGAEWKEVSVTATLLVPLDWKAEKQQPRIRRLVNSLTQEGCLKSFALGDETQPRRTACRVCGWVHDAAFTQITSDDLPSIMLRGILPDIVRQVHRAHEKGFAGLSTKNEELLKTCGGYKHPCKAFDSLKKCGEYKLLFDTSRRGFISLRGALGIYRKKSEASLE